MPAYYLWNVAPRNRDVARIFPLGRERDVKDAMLCRCCLALHLEALRVPSLEDWDHQVFRCSGIGCALQNHQLAFANPRCRSFSGVFHVAQIRLAVLGKRRRNAHDDGVLVRQMREISGGREALLPCALNLGGRNAKDVGPAGFEVCDLLRVYVEACNFEPSLGQQQGKRQSNVSESDDSDPGCAGF